MKALAIAVSSHATFVTDGRAITKNEYISLVINVFILFLRKLCGIFDVFNMPSELFVDITPIVLY